MLEWPLSGDAISARGDETLARGLDETNPERRHVSQGGPVWSSHVVHGRYPLPREGALSESPSRNRNRNQKKPAPLVGWWARNQKRSRPWGPARSAQLRLALTSGSLL